MSVWFVTPAWQRFSLSAVCFEQRRRTMEHLANLGIESECVVVADDENLELARAAGFHTVEQNNDWLGRRFNDGIEYAARYGAEWIVPVGSDSWVDARYFLPLPATNQTRTSRYLVTVKADRALHQRIRPNNGGGPYMLHRSAFRRGFRPATDLIAHSTDRSTINGLGRRPLWRLHDAHPLQHISFRGEVHVTKYEKLKRRWGGVESTTPWDDLLELYPPDLVEAAHAVLAETRTVAA